MTCVDEDDDAVAAVMMIFFSVWLVGCRDVLCPQNLCCDKHREGDGGVTHFLLFLNFSSDLSHWWVSNSMKLPGKGVLPAIGIR